MTGFLTELNSRNIKSIVLNHARRHQPHETNAKRITNNSRNEGVKYVPAKQLFLRKGPSARIALLDFRICEYRRIQDTPKKAGACL